jgi:RNA polymerase sigma factor (TIGR02999 family)
LTLIRSLLRSAQPMPKPPRDAGPKEGRGDVTRWLRAWQAGDEAALEPLLAALYPELRRIARQFFRGEARALTLQPTALVHEAFLRLVGQDRVDWKSRAHFLGVAATMMRRVLVDRARARATAKRGAGATPITAVDPVARANDRVHIDLLALDQALERLAALDAQQAKLVELRYFGGLTIDETATALDVSSATVERDWRSARAFLRRELRSAASP